MGNCDEKVGNSKQKSRIQCRKMVEYSIGKLSNAYAKSVENWEIVMKNWEIPSKIAEYSVGKCSDTV